MSNVYTNPIFLHVLRSWILLNCCNSGTKICLILLPEALKTRTCSDLCFKSRILKVPKQWNATNLTKLTLKIGDSQGLQNEIRHTVPFDWICFVSYTRCEHTIIIICHSLSNLHEALEMIMSLTTASNLNFVKLAIFHKPKIATCITRRSTQTKTV